MMKERKGIDMLRCLEDQKENLPELQMVQFRSPEQSRVDLIDFHVPTKALVLATCPGEELLGCGGTIRKLMDQRSRVKVVYLTPGPMQDDAGRDRSRMRGEAADALGVLGCGDMLFIDEEGGEERQLLQLLNAMCEFGPKELFIPSFGETTPGAQRTALIGMKAMETYPGRIDVNCYEILSPIRPTVLVDISETVRYKFESISKHASTEGIGNLAEKMLGLNAYRSLIAAQPVRFCEAFLRGNDKMMVMEARKARLIP